MSTLDPNLRAPPQGTAQAGVGRYEEARGGGWLLFAGIMMMLVGVLNVIYGIAAIGDSSFFVRDARYVISDLNTWGWITLGIGVLELLAAGSLWRGGLFGRIFGVCAASLSAVGALLSIPAYPYWSLAIFALDIVIIQQICAHGTEGRRAGAQTASAAAGSSTAAEWDAMAQYKQ